MKKFIFSSLLLVLSASFCAAQVGKSADVLPKRVVAKPDPFGQATILAKGGKWTIVPKGSILHLPEKFSNLVVAKPQGKMMPFSQFLKANYSWLRTKEVTSDHVSGVKEVDKKAFESIAYNNLVVVASLHRSPTAIYIKKTDK